MKPDESAAAARQAEADRIWVAAALEQLPPVTASPGLARALLAAFDARTARRRMGALAAFAQAIWPGAPAWAPASAFAFALVAGLGLGAALPSQADAQDARASAAFSLDEPSALDLDVPDSTNSEAVADDPAGETP